MDIGAPIMDEYEESPSDGGFAISSVLIILLMAYLIVTMINGKVYHTKYYQLEKGVQRGLKIYSQTYDRSVDSMRTLGEGYLIEEDQKDASVDTNPVQINNVAGTKTFRRILADNLNVEDSHLDDSSNGVYYLIQITSKFDFKNGVDVSSRYKVDIYDVDGNACGTGSDFSSPENVQNFIESQIGGISIDFANNLNADLHKKIEYSKQGKTGNAELTASTFNTFVCIGKNVRLQGAFNTIDKKTVDIMELESYATSR